MSDEPADPVLEDPAAAAQPLDSRGPIIGSIRQHEVGVTVRRMPVREANTAHQPTRRGRETGRADVEGDRLSLGAQRHDAPDQVAAVREHRLAAVDCPNAGRPAARVPSRNLPVRTVIDPQSAAGVAITPKIRNVPFPRAIVRPSRAPRPKCPHSRPTITSAADPSHDHHDPRHRPEPPNLVEHLFPLRPVGERLDPTLRTHRAITARPSNPVPRSHARQPHSRHLFRNGCPSTTGQSLPASLAAASSPLKNSGAAAVRRRRASCLRSLEG